MNPWVCYKCTAKTFLLFTVSYSKIILRLELSSYRNIMPRAKLRVALSTLFRETVDDAQRKPQKRISIYIDVSCFHHSMCIFTSLLALCIDSVSSERNWRNALPPWINAFRHRWCENLGITTRSSRIPIRSVADYRVSIAKCFRNVAELKRGNVNPVARRWVLFSAKKSITKIR